MSGLLPSSGLRAVALLFDTCLALNIPYEPKKNILQSGYVRCYSSSSLGGNYPPYLFETGRFVHDHAPHRTYFSKQFTTRLTLWITVKEVCGTPFPDLSKHLDRRTVPTESSCTAVGGRTQPSEAEHFLTSMAFAWLGGPESWRPVIFAEKGGGGTGVWVMLCTPQLGDFSENSTRRLFPVSTQLSLICIVVPQCLWKYEAERRYFLRSGQRKL